MRILVAEDVADDFVEHIGLHGLLHKMASAFLEGRKDVVLIADGRDHDNARLGMLAHDALDGLDALHLRHSDVHKHDVGLGARVFRDGRAAVARLAGDLAAKRVDHLRQILARENRVVNDEIPDRLVVFLSRQRRKWFHHFLLQTEIVFSINAFERLTLCEELLRKGLPRTGHKENSAEPRDRGHG